MKNRMNGSWMLYGATGYTGTLITKEAVRRGHRPIGVAIGNHEQGWFNAEWCYAKSLWEQDEHMEKLLAENNPLRAVKVGELPRYTHKTNGGG